MQGAHVVVRGSYRYASRDMLEQAVRLARAQMADDEPEPVDADWIALFVPTGAALHVDAVLPAAADRYVAAEVIRAFARRAIAGMVELRCAGRVVDSFCSGDDSADDD